jgi:small subunit ribosomal protein S16
MVRIRLQRHGSTHTPNYRLVATESSVRRDGRFVEILGSYNPTAKGKTPEVTINLDRVNYWLGVGAQPSDTARSLIKRYGKIVAKSADAAPVAA